MNFYDEIGEVKISTPTTEPKEPKEKEPKEPKTQKWINDWFVLFGFFCAMIQTYYIMEGFDIIFFVVRTIFITLIVIKVNLAINFILFILKKRNK